jgi:hypothetical protein
MKTTAQRTTVLKAIEIVNKREGYHIELNRDSLQGKWFHFTIKSKSGIPGSRTSSSGRKLPCASWHAHGYIFDQIFELEPKSIVWSNGKKITNTDGNWNDANIGSVISPCYFSDTSIL